MARGFIRKVTHFASFIGYAGRNNFASDKITAEI